jgi:tRNA uridine 5-carbamoylmethylation protein Kti12
MDKATSPASIEISSSNLTISGSKINYSNEIPVLTFSRAFALIVASLNSDLLISPNVSTISIPHTNPNHLYELDRITQIVVKLIISHQNDKVAGTPIIFDDYDRIMTLHRFVGIGELQRFRKQFMKANGMMENRDKINIGTSFIDYLSGQL